MSSGGFPGAGDFYSSLAGRLAAANGAGGGGFGKRTLTEMERQQLQQALLFSSRSVKHKTSSTTPTSNNPGLHHNQQQNHQLQHPYYHASPISPLAHPLSPAAAADNIDYSCSPHPSSAVSCSSSSTTSASGTTASSAPGNTPSPNGMTSQLAFIKQQQHHHHQLQQRQLLLLQQQQQLLQRKAAGLFPHSSNNGGSSILGSTVAGVMGGGGQGGGGFGCYPTNAATPTPTPQQHRLAAPVLQPTHQQQPPAERAEVRNRLMELEKQLLDDDDDGDGGSGTPASAAAGGLSASPSGADASPSVLDASGWSETMQSLLISSASSSCCTPPQPQQQQQPPTPTTTTSAASSCCSSSSPPTASSSSGSPAPAKQLLMDSAAAIAEGNTDSATTTLATLQRNIVNTSSTNNIGCPRGAVDAEQRLNGYMAAALLSRINNNSSDASPCSSDQLRTPEHLVSTHFLYEACPFFKLGFLAANLAVLNATRGAAVIHILDFDVGHGAQLLPLLLSLADRPAAARPALVKITAVSDPAANPYTTNVWCAAMVRAAGERLAKAGERAGMAIRFNAVTTRSGGEAASSSDQQYPPPPWLSRHAIGCDPDESLVVRLAFHLSRVPDESVTPANPRDDLLRRIKSMNPAVVALAEQELSGNTAPFLPRFNDAHTHYAALFDSLQQHQDGGACTPPAMEMLTRAEECLGRKAANTVGREGSGRVERCEVFGKWRARMSMAGFRPIALPAGAVESLRARVSGRAAGEPASMTTTGGGGGVGAVVAVKEENGGVGFAWNGRTITVTSAWR